MTNRNPNLIEVSLSEEDRQELEAWHTARAAAFYEELPDVVTPPPPEPTPLHPHRMVFNALGISALLLLGALWLIFR
jgi:hypothetical protein